MTPPSSGISGRGAGVAGLQLELQRSEARRAEILAAVFIVLGLSTVVRHFLGGATLGGAAFFPTVLLSAGSVAWALALRRFTERATDQGRVLATWIWAGTVVVESFFPTAALLIQMHLSNVGQVDAVRSPAGLVYGVLAVTAVLRLRPILCELGGVVCGVQHIVLASVALSSISREEAVRVAPILYAYSVFIIIGWVVAAMISRELRRHVVAGLREAQARAELAEVTGELNVARQIQQRLMPRGQLALPGYEIVGWNRPAGQTGGDYYDWITLPNGRVAVAIADVTGHGVGPALIMAVCRAYARATIPDVSPLNAGLSRLNHLLSEDVDDGRFVTSAYVVLDPEAGTVELLSAGHGPTVFRRADGSSEVFGGDGPPLGVVPGIDFDPPRQFEIHPGDALLLVTDGFVEAQDAAGKMFGTERLRSFLALNNHLSGGELLSRLDATVRAHVGAAPQADDMTAVMIRRVPVNHA